MALFDNEFKVTSLLQSAASLFQLNKGIGIQGNTDPGLGYRQEAASLPAITQYNIALDKRDLAMQLDIFQKQLSAAVGEQTGQAAASGIDVGSQSPLSVINQGLNQATSAIIDARNNQKILADQRMFQMKQQQVELENRARMAEYSAEVQAFQAKQSRFKYIPSLLNQAFSFKEVTSLGK